MNTELLTSILEACRGEVYELREKLCLACLLVPCYVREQGSPSWPPDGLQSLAPPHTTSFRPALESRMYVTRRIRQAGGVDEGRGARSGNAATNGTP